jgi:anti-sigma regulatory factor (Ser/Thr protein kinase)
VTDRHDLLAEVFEQLPVPLAVTDADGREIVAMNAAARAAPDAAFLGSGGTPVRRPDGSIRAFVRVGRSPAESPKDGLLLQLQDAVLPKGLPVLPGVEVAARYLLADDADTGGDWFDAVPLADGRMVVVVGDVVGHGIEASVAMGELKTLFEERVRVDGDLVAALELLDARARRLQQSRSTTVCAATLDPATGELCYCTAGHPPPVVVTAEGEAVYLPATGAGPLASGHRFTTARHTLGPGEVLLLYSDGLVERPGRSASQNTVDLLRVAADAVSDAVAAGEAVASSTCRRTLEQLTASSGYDDDITLLVVQRVPAPPPLSLRLPAVPDALRTVRADLDTWLRALRVAPLDRMAVQHAVGELVSNAVEHAYDDVDVRHPLAVDARLTSGGMVEFVVADRGRWRSNSPDRRGRGLALASGLLDEFELVHDDGGTRACGRHRVSNPAELLRGTSAPASGETSPTYALGVIDDVLHAAGSLDAEAAVDLRAGLNRASRGGSRRVTVDLAEVDLLCSAAVQSLYEARSAGPIELIAPMGSPAQHVLELVRLPYRS